MQQQTMFSCFSTLATRINQEAAALSIKKMLIFLISCFSVLLLSKSFLRPRKASKADQPRMCLFPWIFLESPHRYLVSLIRRRKLFTSSFQAPSFFSPPAKRFSMDKTDHGISILDLPDLPLDCILEKLSPVGLCSTAGVCTSLKERCKSDYLWEKHLNQKWGKVINDATYKEWQFYISSKRSPKFFQKSEKLHLFSKFLGGSRSEKSGFKSTFPPVNSAMSLYLALESGKFWFPAQVFNRENGHVGFMLSCYDAKLSYDSTTDMFVARYPAQGRSMIEEDIEWDRIRATGVGTPPNVLHVSDCLYELKPNDHIEIQWRRNKDFPYGWWYGVVGHLDTCIGNQFNCHCHINDIVIVEFKQYTSGSKWRKMVISRKDHREVGSEADGFYGGIRKLYKSEDIARWEQLQPDCQGAIF